MILEAISIAAALGTTTAISVTNTVTAWRGRVQQRKLQEESRKFTNELERQRQGFQVYYQTRSMQQQESLEIYRSQMQKQLNKQTIEEQLELQKRSQEAMIALEKLRNSYSVELFERNRDLQRELVMQGHIYRLKEQTRMFNNNVLLADYQKFLSTWPLIVSPDVAKASYELPDGNISLVVILSISNNADFNKFVYPFVQQGLNEFVGILQHSFGVCNIVFFQNAYHSPVSGTGMTENIHCVLKGLPTLILGIDVLPGEICVDFTVWGLGNFEKKAPFSFFKLPYIIGKITQDRKVDIVYYRDIADQILIKLKFLMGYTFDCYNYIEFNNPPLLSVVAENENQRKDIRESAKLLSDANFNSMISQYYLEMYSSVFPNTNDGIVLSSFLNKNVDQPTLRLNFSKAIRDSITNEEYSIYLYNAICSWVLFRTNKHGIEDFIQKLISDNDKLRQYCDLNDRDFFNAVTEELSYAIEGSTLFSLAKQLADKLNNIDLSANTNSKTVTQMYNSHLIKIDDRDYEI
jgi:hypothetical protein